MSFGAHYDPDNVAFGPMVCHDDHLLASGRGFETHRHADLEIVSWVLSGSLTHTDSSGASVTVEPGSVAVLCTGSGVEHAEVAASPQTRFVQVWLRPDADQPALEPSYAVTPVDLPSGSLVEVARPVTGARFLVARLESGDTVTLPDERLQHVYLGRGALVRSSMAEPLLDGDAFRITDDPGLQLTAAVPTELLVWAFA